MILVKEKKRNGIVKNVKRIYINTLVPFFEYRNKKGEIIRPIKCSVLL